MNLFQEFMAFAKREGIPEADIQVMDDPNAKIVSFWENIDKEKFNVTLVLYSTNDAAEIFVRKRMKNQESIESFAKVNELNKSYRGVAFYLDNGTVGVKAYCDELEKIDKVLMQMVRAVNVAREEFKVF